MFVFSFHLTAFFQNEFFVSYLSSGIFSKSALKANSDGVTVLEKAKQGQAHVGNLVA